MLKNSGYRQNSNAEFNLTEAQVNAIIDAAQSTRDKLILELLASTAIRRSELIALTAQDLDVERSFLMVRDGKGGKSRQVFLPSQLVMELKDFRELECAAGTSRIFQARNGKISPRQINNIVRRCSQRAGVKSPNPYQPHVGPHQLRHSFARRWKSRGGSMETLQRQMGHASLKTTMDLYGKEGAEEAAANYAALMDVGGNDERMIGQALPIILQAGVALQGKKIGLARQLLGEAIRRLDYVSTKGKRPAPTPISGR